MVKQYRTKSLTLLLCLLGVCHLALSQHTGPINPAPLKLHHQVKDMTVHVPLNGATTVTIPSNHMNTSTVVNELPEDVTNLINVTSEVTMRDGSNNFPDWMSVDVVTGEMIISSRADNREGVELTVTFTNNGDPPVSHDFKLMTRNTIDAPIGLEKGEYYLGDGDGRFDTSKLQTLPNGNIFFVWSQGYQNLVAKVFDPSSGRTILDEFIIEKDACYPKIALMPTFPGNSFALAIQWRSGGRMDRSPHDAWVKVIDYISGETIVDPLLVVSQWETFKGLFFEDRHIMVTWTSLQTSETLAKVVNLATQSTVTEFTLLEFPTFIYDLVFLSASGNILLTYEDSLRNKDGVIINPKSGEIVVERCHLGLESVLPLELPNGNILSLSSRKAVTTAKIIDPTNGNTIRENMFSIDFYDFTAQVATNGVHVVAAGVSRTVPDLKMFVINGETLELVNQPLYISNDPLEIRHRLFPLVATFYENGRHLVLVAWSQIEKNSRISTYGGMTLDVLSGRTVQEPFLLSAEYETDWEAPLLEVTNFNQVATIWLRDGGQLHAMTNDPLTGKQLVSQQHQGPVVVPDVVRVINDIRIDTQNGGIQKFDKPIFENYSDGPLIHYFELADGSVPEWLQFRADLGTVDFSWRLAATGIYNLELYAQNRYGGRISIPFKVELIIHCHSSCDTCSGPTNDDCLMVIENSLEDTTIFITLDEPSVYKIPTDFTNISNVRYEYAMTSGGSLPQWISFEEDEITIISRADNSDEIELIVTAVARRNRVTDSFKITTRNADDSIPLPDGSQEETYT